MSGPVPAASVVICTNRPWHYATACLESLYRQELPARCFEILIVDNAPQRRPPPDFLQPSPTHVALHWLHEPQPGLSHARNHGASQAQAPVIVYIDDDATAVGNWLGDLLSPFDADPALAVLGGPIELALPAALPWWYAPALDGWFSRFDPPAEGIRPVNGFSELPYGANFAIRKSVWQRLGGFDSRLGRSGRDLAGGEDLDFCLRALAAGLQVCTAPAPRVLHHITGDRIALRALWKASRQAGLSLARLGSRNNRVNWLRQGLVLLLKSCYPFRRMPLGVRLNYLLRCRLHLTAALSLAARAPRYSDHGTPPVSA